MAHKALQRWRFPCDKNFEGLLHTCARQEGLIEEDLLRQAIHLVKVLLGRFQRHPLFGEIDHAIERYHELPYTWLPHPDGQAEWGFMDCLYRTPDGWVVIDFKTDDLRDQPALNAAVEKYRDQLIRYQKAAERLVGDLPKARMCFLNCAGSVEVITFE